MAERGRRRPRRGFAGRVPGCHAGPPGPTKRTRAIGAPQGSRGGRKAVPAAVAFGVFLYRSANPRTLQQLSEFLPVPVEGITREFEAGLTAEEICARTISALREVGVDKVYLSNLGFERPDARYRRIVEQL